MQEMAFSGEEMAFCMHDFKLHHLFSFPLLSFLFSQSSGLHKRGGRQLLSTLGDTLSIKKRHKENYLPCKT